MEASYGASDLIGARADWTRMVAERFVAPTSVRKLDLKCTSVERALALAHVGISHIFGFSSVDCALSILGPTDAVEVISREYRTGSIEPFFLRNLMLLWEFLLVSGRDHALISLEVATEIFDSPFGRHVRHRFGSDLSSRAVERRVLDLASAHLAAFAQGPLTAPRSWDLPVDGAYLGFLRALGTEVDYGTLLESLTPFEMVAYSPQDDQAKGDDTAVVRALQHQHLYAAMPGGWPDEAGNTVPTWVRDSVVNHGGRWDIAGCGAVPGWFIVTESEEERRALDGLRYRPALGLDVHDPEVPQVVLQIEYPDKTYGVYRFRYPRKSAQHARWFGMLIALGYFRIDVYKLDAGGELEYCYSFGELAPDEWRDLARELIKEHPIDQADEEVFSPHTPETLLQAMAQSERANFEDLLYGYGSPISAEAAETYEIYLEQSAVVADDYNRGAVPDLTELSRTKELFRVAMSRTEREKVGPLDLSVLGPGRGVVQFSIHVDEPLALTALFAFLDREGNLHCDGFEFSAEIDLDSSFTNIAQLSEYLTGGLAQFSDLIEHIDKLVVCPAPGAFTLPYHDALFRLGYKEVTYSHRLATLDRASDTAFRTAAVAAFPGEGDEYIQSVEFEAAAIAGLYEAPEGRPDVLHLAGHGRTGSTSEQIWLVAEQGTVLSPATVLLERTGEAVHLAYLSACSTAAVDHSWLSATSAIPMDVALIESGAQVVVAAGAPVNDVVAGLFAMAFHTSLRGGLGIWHAYMDARALLASTSPSPSLALEAVLSFHWADWRTALEKVPAHQRDDWRYFRVSGRPW